MSRIGRMPVEIPAGVTVTVNGNNVTVKGPKGTLTQNFSERITVAVEGNQIIVTRPTDEKEDRSLHGLTRALVQNMVTGVSTGYRKVLLVIGVGYKVVKTGKDLQLYLGHSLMPGKGVPQAKYIISETDTVKLLVPSEAEIKAQEIDKMTTEKVNSGNVIVVEGIDKQEVGQIAAVIRSKRPPEPYHGKGVKYSDEHIRRKAGQAGQ